ncbi:hypothetical protein [Sinomonas halotolerans]|uniref:Uncharacterized protein n=1 Tax=Sinomonas halotolerans TaxID=1644133 RepID=A0ABU9WX76_9MICC
MARKETERGAGRASRAGQAGKKPAGRPAAGRPAAGAAGRPSGRPGQRRQSPAVYRRRRIAVLVLGLLVLGLLGFGGWAAALAVGSLTGAPWAPGPGGSAGGSGSSAAASPGTTATGASAGASPSSASPGASPTPSCSRELITVTASTDKPVYQPTEKPLFTLRVTNGNPLPCEVNVGTSQMEFLVVSGTDRIFSSKDCQADFKDLPKVIPAGKSEAANFPWPRTRSVEGCRAVKVAPKPGYYVLTASLGATTSSKAVFELK